VQKWICLILLCESLILSSRANAGFEDIKHYPQNVWDFELTSRYLSTNSNFTSAGGAYANFPSNYSYSLEDFNFFTRTVMPGSNVSFWGDSQVSAAQSKNPAQSLTTTGLTHIRLGSDFVLFHDAFNIIPEFYFANSSVPAISDGVMKLSAKLFLEFQFGSFWVEGFSGYIWQDQGRAALIPYGAVGEFRFSSWSFGGNIQGYSSASTDTNTSNNAQQLNWMSNVNGGSELFDAINPQVLEFNVWGKFNLTRNFSMFAGGGTTINGQNIANYWDIQFGLAYRWPTGKFNRPRPKTEVERFNEETSDGVDQSLFDVRPPVPQPQNQHRSVSPQNIQKELDKTEIQIDMKSIDKPHKDSTDQEPLPSTDK